MGGLEETTRLCSKLGEGDQSAASKLLPLIYDELHDLAARYMQHECLDHTWQPTALVHEVYLRLVDAKNIDWRDRSQFLALAARQIRKILIDHARRRNAAKRGANAERIPFNEELHAAPTTDIDVVALNDALDELAKRSPRQAQVVEYRFFAGMTVEEVAEVLGVSQRTIKGDWRAAKAWLAGQMRD